MFPNWGHNIFTCNDMQHCFKSQTRDRKEQKIADIEGMIRTRKSKKDSLCNLTKKTKKKRTNNNLQNTKQKTKGRAPQTSL